MIQGDASLHRARSRRGASPLRRSRHEQPQTRRPSRLAAPLIALFLAAMLLARPTPLDLGIPSDLAERQREAFLEVEAALARGDGQAVAPQLAALRDYPLYPYLAYAGLPADLAAADPAAIDAFLTEHADTPLAHRLRGAWLDRLARLGRWPEYLARYRPDGSVARHCQALHALIATGRTAEALEQVAQLWLVGHSQPAACDPVFDAWRAAGHLTTDLTWQRIALAMAAGELRLARYLGRYLPEAERPWLERWLATHHDPTRVEDLDPFAAEHPRRAEILADGLARLARRDPERAAAAWEAARTRLPFPPAETAEVQAALGLALLAVDADRAFGYLDQVQATAGNLAFQERRLRAALAREDWPRTASWLAQMPEGVIKDERWRYWQARAAAALGQEETARALYRQAATVRGFWGFLAADQVGLPYNLAHRPTPTDERLRRLAASPALRRIEELDALGRQAEVRREWAHLTRDLEGEELAAAALVASYLGWPDRAIQTLARSGQWDDLDLRFPVLHRDQIQAEAAATGLPESWIFAVVRQESAFAPGAGSPVGAIGLMQLMPATAREVAQRLGQPPPTRAALQEPETNIRLGSRYLAQMARRFGGDAALATAAYNAGPGRVRQWLPQTAKPADLWIATIPFAETRGYVERVLAYRLIYADRLGVADGPLSAWLAPIGTPQPEALPETQLTGAPAPRLAPDG